MRCNKNIAAVFFNKIFLGATNALKCKINKRVVNNEINFFFIFFEKFLYLFIAITAVAFKEVLLVFWVNKSYCLKPFVKCYLPACLTGRPGGFFVLKAF